MVNRRALLFVPATAASFIARAHARGADVIWPAAGLLDTEFNLQRPVPRNS